MTVDGFGGRVRHFREARGMTQGALAATVGRSHSMLSAIEHGTRQAHIDELLVFADALRVPPTALLGTEDRDRFAEGYDAGFAAAIDRVRGLLDASTSAPPEQGGRDA